MFSLYPYQSDAVREVSAALRQGFRRPLVVLPTGGGKTVLAAHMLKVAIDNRHTGLFVVHRQELLDQACETIRKTGINPVKISAGAPPGAMESKASLKVATIQTLSSRIRSGSRVVTLNNRNRWRPSFIWWDEAHHCAAKTWNFVADHYRALNPDLCEIGLTATPRRTDGKPLGDFFDVLLEGPDIRELINQRRLSDYVLYAPETPLHALRAQFHTKMGDFSSKEQGEAAEKYAKFLAGNAVDVYEQNCPGEQAIFFGASIAHSQSVMKRFRDRGWEAAHVDGEMELRARRKIIDGFREGRTQVLCNCALISEGFDVPECSVVIFGRATQSLTVWLQACGRALRYRPDKVAKIIDQGWNWESLGKPDQPREWSLRETAGEEGGGGEAEADSRLKRCDKCHAVEVPVRNEDGAMTCPKCGAAHAKALPNVQEIGDVKMIAVGGRVNGSEVPRGYQMRLNLRMPNKNRPVSRKGRMGIGDLVKEGGGDILDTDWSEKMKDLVQGG